MRHSAPTFSRFRTRRDMPGLATAPDLKCVRRRRARRRGVALVFVLISLPIILAFVSFAVDCGYILVVKTDLRNAVDAACLAGASGLRVSPTEARTRAKAIAASNTVAGHALTLLDSDIQIGTWDATTRAFTLLTGSAESDGNALRVTGQLSTARGTAVGLFFRRLLPGPSSVEITRTSTSLWGGGAAADVVVVQDVTGSFSDEISEAKKGNQDLLGSLNVSGSACSFGLVAFTGWGKTVATLKPVTSNYTSLNNAVKSLTTNDSSAMPTNGTGTDIAAGMEQGLAVFDSYPTSASRRIMVIVSDGEPNQDSGGMHPTKNDNQLLKLAQQDADAVWAKGIDVCVVFWDSGNSATAAANLATLVRGKGKFVHVTDPAKLSEAINAAGGIAAKLVK
jgi:Flp pilus assembly protein TadG